MLCDGMTLHLIGDPVNRWLMREIARRSTACIVGQLSLIGGVLGLEDALSLHFEGQGSPSQARHAELFCQAQRLTDQGERSLPIPWSVALQQRVGIAILCVGDCWPCSHACVDFQRLAKVPHGIVPASEERGKATEVVRHRPEEHGAAPRRGIAVRVRKQKVVEPRRSLPVPEHDAGLGEQNDGRQPIRVSWHVGKILAGERFEMRSRLIRAVGISEQDHEHRVGDVPTMPIKRIDGVFRQVDDDEERLFEFA